MFTRGYSGKIAGLLGLLSALGCSSSYVSSEEARAEESALFARSSSIWPLRDGVAQVRVCWAAPRLASTYPVASIAPNVDERLPALRQWVREVVEAEWNTKTPLEFTGWGDCGTDSDAVELTTIDSAVTPICGNQGQSCVVTSGKQLLERQGVFLNLFFGEEVLYSSRYQQRIPGGIYQVSMEVNGTAQLKYPWWVPQNCMDDFKYPWSTNNTLTRHRVDIDASANLAEFMAIYERCLKFSVLHEFGHIAGFVHEQQRKDVPAGCSAETNADVQYQGDTPLGPFDKQSVMSYCRTDPTPTLTEEDVEQTTLVYGESFAFGGAAGAATSPGTGGAAAGARGTDASNDSSPGCSVAHGSHAPAPSWALVLAWIGALCSRRRPGKSKDGLHAKFPMGRCAARAPRRG